MDWGSGTECGAPRAEGALPVLSGKAQQHRDFLSTFLQPTTTLAQRFSPGEQWKQRSDTKLRNPNISVLPEMPKFYLPLFFFSPPTLPWLFLVVLWRILDRLWGCPSPGLQTLLGLYPTDPWR